VGQAAQVQQWYATDHRRAQDPYYWSKSAFSKVDRLKADVVIFDDFRFPGEYDGIHDRGGYCAKISRLGWKSDMPEHISETILDGHPFDAHLGVKNGELPIFPGNLTPALRQYGAPEPIFIGIPSTSFCRRHMDDCSGFHCVVWSRSSRAAPT
jgi:hypothetical protein